VSQFPADLMATIRCSSTALTMQWLTAMFGLREHVARQAPDGRIVHAEMIHGTNGMLILGDIAIPSEVQRFAVQPGKASTYLVMSETDVEAAFTRVQASEASGECEVVLELDRPAYGGATFTCADRDGHYWTIGSYRPLM